MVAFPYRMGAGSPGDVNRSHPASIEPNMQDATLPVLGYGYACVVNSAGNGVRQIQTTDTALTTIWGVAVRPYPIQQQSSTNYGSVNIGAATPPTTLALDVMRSGYIMVPLGGTTPAVKGGAVYVWIAASTGTHVQGGFEAAAGGGSNTILLTDAFFNGGADASGVVELEFNV